MTPSRKGHRVGLPCRTNHPPDLSHRMPPKKCLLSFFSHTTARTPPVAFGTSRLCFAGRFPPWSFPPIVGSAEPLFSRPVGSSKIFSVCLSSNRPAGPMARRLTTTSQGLYLSSKSRDCRFDPCVGHSIVLSIRQHHNVVGYPFGHFPASWEFFGIFSSLAALVQVCPEPSSVADSSVLAARCCS
jgi:hypothetical protein